MSMKRAILIAGLLALPATASANVGVSIAPGVGLELGLYLPDLILIEFLVLRLALPLSWKQALACSTDWGHPFGKGGSQPTQLSYTRRPHRLEHFPV